MILLVEDQPLLAMTTQCALKEAGYKVALATSGQQALEILAGGLTPAVLLTDIRLGRGLNGWQLALRAREHDPALRLSTSVEIPIRTRVSAPFLEASC